MKLMNFFGKKESLKILKIDFYLWRVYWVISLRNFINMKRIK